MQLKDLHSAWHSPARIDLPLFMWQCGIVGVACVLGALADALLQGPHRRLCMNIIYLHFWRLRRCSPFHLLHRIMALPPTHSCASKTSITHCAQQNCLSSFSPVPALKCTKTNLA